MQIRKSILFIVLLAVAVGGAVLSAKTTDRAATEARKKARHYYLTAARYDAEGTQPEASELYKKAYQADSTYAEAALQYGIRRWGMPVGDLAGAEMRQESKRIARKFIDMYPGDIFPNLLYSNMMEESEELEESISVMESLLKHHPGNSDILQVLTGLYLDVDEPDKAMDALDKYARIEGEDASYFVRKAGMRLATGDTLGTLAEADRMIEKYPNDPKSMAFKARLQAYFQMLDEAEESFKKAEEMSKKGAGGSIKMQMADYYLMRNDSVNYDKKTYEALMAEDLDFEMKHDVLAFYLQKIVDDKSDWSRGDALFSALLDQYPHEPRLLSLAARYSAARKNYKKAMEEVDYALDLDKTNSKYWNQAMTYALLMDDYDKVMDYYKRALKELSEPEIELYEIAAGSCMIADKPAEALDIYSTALEKFFPGQTPGGDINFEALAIDIDPAKVFHLATLYQELGDVFYKLGRKPETFKSYDNSLMLNEDAPLTLNNYAYFLIEDGKDLSEETLQKADDMSKKATTLAPDYPTYLDTRAWVLFRKGEYKQAKEIQLKALELIKDSGDESEHAEFNEHLGDILFMNHEPEAALEAWKKALELNPKSEILRRKVKHKTFFFE
ncbi:MAG: tetratricopeptide repeat protein [Muribaculaceae bacterium]|nr:tetratricopeptide repeat protein [Muribaculaceae bacterium]